MRCSSQVNSPFFEIPNHEAAGLIRNLLELGYIESDGQKNIDCWELTVAGRAFSMASAAAPLKRNTASRKLRELLHRVELLNQDPHFVYRIQRLGVFGSYLGASEELGDIDVAFELTPKESDSNQHDERCAASINEALSSGRSFGNFLEQLNWPREEVLRFLKARSRAYSFHDISDARAIGAEVKLIYPPEEAHLVIPPSVPMKKSKTAKLRRFRVSAIQEIQLKGCRIVTHPEDGVPCLKVGKKYYQPTIAWMEYFTDGPGGPHWATSGTECVLDRAVEVFDETYDEIPPSDYPAKQHADGAE